MRNGDGQTPLCMVQMNKTPESSKKVHLLLEARCSGDCSNGQLGFRSITKERNLAELLRAALTGDCEVPAEWIAILVAVYPVAMNTPDDFGRLPIHPLCRLSKKR